MSGVLALVTARGGSKGLPGKNLRPLAGKPLIVWTIEAALGSAGIDRVLVSTDDAEIARVSGLAGAEVPFLRPPELARDDSPHIDVVEHAMWWLDGHAGPPPAYLLLLQPTSPLRTTADIDAALAIARETGAPAVVGVTEPQPHPLKTYRLAADGTLAPFVESDIAYKRRQDLPPALAENGAIYLNRCDALRSLRTFVPPGTRPYLMPPERSVDIDSPLDFALAEFLLGTSAVRARRP